MKTVNQIKQEVLDNSTAPHLFVINVMRVHGKTYTVNQICGLFSDCQAFVNSMKREGYTVFEHYETV